MGVQLGFTLKQDQHPLKLSAANTEHAHPTRPLKNAFLFLLSSTISSSTSANAAALFSVFFLLMSSLFLQTLTQGRAVVISAS